MTRGYIVLFVMMAASVQIHATELVVSQLNAVVDENFDGFRGLHETLPHGFAVSADGRDLLAATNDYRGASGGGETTGGCYAWNISEGDFAIGCQPTETKFTPGYFLVAISNATGTAVNEISVSYDVVCLNNADRSSALHFELSVDGNAFERQEGMSFVSPLLQDKPASWARSTYSCNIRFRKPVSADQRIWLRWYVDDAAGSYARDEYGLDNVRLIFHCRRGTVITIN